MENTISIISFIVSVLSAAFGLFNFFFPSVRERKQATLDAYNRLQEQALDQLNLYKPQRMEEIAQNPGSEEYKKVSKYIARIEHFSVGVNQRIYDGRVVYELAHGYLDGAIRNRIEPIITMKNRSGHDFYANIHKLYKQMDATTTKLEKAQK